MFNFCPSCASKNITFSEGKAFRCPDCGFVYYHNIAAATGCLIVVPQPDGGEKLVFTVRGKEPAAGKLDLPGGFVDIGEGAIEGLYREMQEEIGWVPPIPKDLMPAGAGSCGLSELAQINFGNVFTLFASFSNVYEYKSIKYNTCDMYFSVIAPGLTPGDMNPEKSEIADVLFLSPNEIDFSKFAFPSTVRAVKTYLGDVVADIP
jgi:8-oxo-dGTP pyrophosphatase MutT (NUDIX family)